MLKLITSGAWRLTTRRELPWVADTLGRWGLHRFKAAKGDLKAIRPYAIYVHCLTHIDHFSVRYRSS